MTDQELADKIVALGVGSERSGYYSHLGGGFLAEKLQPAPPWFRKSNGLASEFVRDWRVAGALMEKAKCGRWCSLANDRWYSSANDFPIEGESLPRAINEACVEALSD